MGALSSPGGSFSRLIFIGPYWMQNKVLFDIPFCMHTNLQMIIKILSSIYLSLAVFFLYVPIYWHNESWVHKTQTFVHDTAQTGSIPNHNFSTTIIPLRTLSNFVKFYLSASKLLYLMIVL